MPTHIRTYTRTVAHTTRMTPPTGDDDDDDAHDDDDDDHDNVTRTQTHPYMQLYSYGHLQCFHISQPFGSSCRIGDFNP